MDEKTPGTPRRGDENLGKEKRSSEQEIEDIDKRLAEIQKELYPAANITDLSVTTLDKVEEKEAEWLFTGYIPKGQITMLCGDGGVGKSTLWCALAAAVSTGERSFLEDAPEEWMARSPGTVLFFSGEDTAEYTLVRRLKRHNADLSKIAYIDAGDPRFLELKFNSQLLRDLLEEHKPTLCIFDPLQAFVPPDIQMGSRNAMRQCLEPLIGYGKEYGTTFLIVMHTNKRPGAWGRNRMADSADIWDISRSVLIAGETTEKGVRYLSQEKSNYAPLCDTVLFKILDEKIEVSSRTDKKDRDFVSERDSLARQAPAVEEAKSFIWDYLDEEREEYTLSDLLECARAAGLKERTLQRAERELKEAGMLKTRGIGFGKDKKYLISRST